MNTTNQTTTVTIEVAKFDEMMRAIRHDFENLPYSVLYPFPTVPEVRGEADILAGLDAIRDHLATLAEVLGSVAESNWKTEVELKVHREAIDGIRTLKRLLG